MEDSHVQQYEIRQSSFCLVEKDEIGRKLVGQIVIQMVVIFLPSIRRYLRAISRE
jgi:hypothetical protein